jgi:glycosyltransferase involved in cell wall biosynthesis
MPSSCLTVALVSTQRDWHGGEEQARLLAVGLRRRGCRCAILARRGGALAGRMAADGFEVFSFSGNGRSPAALWQIRRHLRRLRPDVLRYNASHAVSGAGLAALGLPIAARIAARRVSFPLRSPWIYRWLCDFVACVSRDVFRMCLRDGIPEAMLRVVHDGVDPARVWSGDRQRGRLALGLADHQTLLLTVAKLTDPKGHRFLLEALPTVIGKVPQLVVALAGDGELRETLERQAQQLGIQSHVRFLGYRHDVPDLIHAADLFVLPSLAEGLCSTLIDVMLAERPIVTTTAGGIPELVGAEKSIEDQSTYNPPSPPAPLPQAGEGSSAPVAWTVSPGDSQALADAILLALESLHCSATMQRQARQRAESLFTADCMVEATLAMYREAVQKAESRKWKAEPE